LFELLLLQLQLQLLLLAQGDAATRLSTNSLQRTAAAFPTFQVL
jgi:hypothetical protein